MNASLEASTPRPGRAHVLPLRIEPDAATGRTPGSLITWAQEKRASLQSLRLNHGAMLFRGFDFSTLGEQGRN